MDDEAVVLFVVIFKRVLLEILEANLEPATSFES
jgi:hypothetical protein